MGEENDEASTLLFCASCGMGEIDDAKLKYCKSCDLVKYCNDWYEEMMCKKRAAELRDELLFKFKQQESCYRWDCPISSKVQLL